MKKAKNIKRARPAPTGEQETLFDEPAAAVNPILKTQKEVAALYKVKLRMVGYWIAEGMPVMADGNYDSHSITPWLIEQGKGPYRANKPKPKGAVPPPTAPMPGADGDAEPDLTWDKDRWEQELKMYKALLAEVDYKKRTGQLLPRDQVNETWSRLIVGAKNRLLGVSTKVAPRLYGKEIIEIERILSAELREILGVFSGGETPATEQEEKEVSTTGDTGSTGEKEEVLSVDERR